MPKDSVTSSARIREQLSHPVIDSDGHMIEFFPAFQDYLNQVAGPDLTAKVVDAIAKNGSARWYGRTEEERNKWRIARPPFWVTTTKNHADRATSMLPMLMRERLDSFGIDYAVIYPTTGFALPETLHDADIRQAACRAHNSMAADLFRPCADRLTPAAVIPCHTPEEAIAELEHCVTQLGFKVVMVANLVRRPVEGVAETAPDLARQSLWADVLALDSEHDYDPFWAKCMDLGVAVTAHAQSQGLGLRRSTTNYMYNQTGHFADAGHAFAKALFFGGVTARFPDLNFAFLECGVAWGCTLYCDLVERWKKRGGDALFQYDPSKLDVDYMAKMFDEYGGDVLAGRISQTMGEQGHTPIGLTPRNYDDPSTLDEFAAANIGNLQDLHDRFVSNFYFGCEADDAMTATAFRSDWYPEKARFKAIIGSDIGHWDVSDMTEVLAEAHELVEDGRLTETDFKDFVFTNPVALHAGMNRNFFKDTVVEDDVEALLAEASPV